MLTNLGFVFALHVRKDDGPVARAYEVIDALFRAVAISQELGNDWLEAQALKGLYTPLIMVGDFYEAIGANTRAAAIEDRIRADVIDARRREAAAANNLSTDQPHEGP
ncbi:hypothetical protein [Streptomyces sp. NPDC001970]